MGGYYIVNGQEKVIRMLILPRRNYVSFKFHGVCEMGEVQLCLSLPVVAIPHGELNRV